MIEIIKAEFSRRMIDEGLARIKQCVDGMSDDQLWYKHNQNTNAVGNIILHLEGNVKQYILSGIRKDEDKRNRDEEFKLESKMDRKTLIDKISKTVTEANKIVSELTKEQMTEVRAVQGFEETVLSIVVHVIEHFSYHVGQITFFTKYVNDVDTAYYEGMDLNQKSN